MSQYEPIPTRTVRPRFFQSTAATRVGASARMLRTSCRPSSALPGWGSIEVTRSVVTIEGPINSSTLRPPTL